MSVWIALLRLRTLPLAVSVIGVGNALAFAQGSWRVDIFALSVFTASALQILSNVANDYGDGIRGTDLGRDADSPLRLTANGLVDRSLVYVYMLLWALVSLLSGGWLLVSAIHTAAQGLLFVFLGVCSIVAALAYTIGRRPYGYCGLGELAVFVFFGLIGVSGSFALQHPDWQWQTLLPAAAMGLLCAAVLNVNNMRDIESDRLAGKYTLAVRLGWERAKRLHGILLVSAYGLLLMFNILSVWQSALWLLLLPLMVRHIRCIYRAQRPQQMAVQLPVAVRLCGGAALLFCAGMVWSV